jgi:hypothetical protein
MQNFDHNIGIREKRHFFRHKLSKIAENCENCENNIDPRLVEFLPIRCLLTLGTFLNCIISPHFWATSLRRLGYALVMTKIGLRYILGDFFTNNLVTLNVLKMPRLICECEWQGCQMVYVDTKNTKHLGGGPWNGKCRYILWPSGIFCGPLEKFMVIWYIL